MQRYEKNLKSYWETNSPTFAHIVYNRWLKSPAKLVESWNTTWLHRMPRRPGRVADYGIGAGLLGEVLLANLTGVAATGYLGLDIAQRQLDAANATLARCGARCAGRYRLELVDRQLRVEQLRGVDAFVSQAVVQHFPSDAYTHRFLDALDSAELARLQWVMLQVRDWGDGRSVALAQRTRRETLQRHLTRYALTWQSSRMRNGYVFYVFEKRRER